MWALLSQAHPGSRRVARSWGLLVLVLVVMVVVVVVVVVVGCASAMRGLASRLRVCLYFSPRFGVC